MTILTHIGSISSFGDVKSATETALITAGWTNTGGWYEKGEVSIRLSVQTGSSPVHEQIKLEARTPGLIESPRQCFMRVSNFSGLSANLDIHISSNPDTVWLSLNMNGDVYSHMGFGYLSKYTPWKGGSWIFGSQVDNTQHIADMVTNNTAGYSSGINGTPDTNVYGQKGNRTGCFTCMPFWETADYVAQVGLSKSTNNFIHCELRGRTWEYDGFGNSDSTASFPSEQILCPSIICPLYAQSVNTFNSQTVLLPFSLGLRVSGRIVPIGFPEHIRFVRLDNYASGDILTVGSQNWKVYPANKRDATYPRGANLIGSPTNYFGSTGFLGIAVRTD